MKLNVIFTIFIVVSLLCMKHVHGQQGFPPADASRDEILTYYKQCARVDEDVVDSVLDMFIVALDFVRARNAANEPLPSVGWMSPSSASDLGWSYNLHIAGQAQQRCFGITWYPEDNVGEGEPAAEAMERLVARGVKIVFATSAEFVGSVAPVALAHPDVMFVIPFPVPDFFAIPNIRAVSMNVWEGTYLSGYAAESMTPESVEYVGVIGAVSNMFTEMQNMNGFYFGMLDAAADMGRSTAHKLVHWWTDSYSDRDRTIYAVRDIATKFDVRVVGQTPDRYESQAWLRDNDFYGTGATGDMGQFLGPSVLTSTYVGWDVPGLFLYGALAASGGNDWGQLPPFIASSVYLGSMGMGTPSVILPADVLARLEAKVALMKTSPYASWFVWCGDRVQDILPDGETLDNVTNCMTVDQSFLLDRLHPAIESQGIFEVPVETVTKDDGQIIGQSVLIAVGYVLLIVILAFTFIYHDDVIVQLSKLSMTYASLMGATIALTGLVLYIPDPTKALCMGAEFLFALGFYALFAFFIAKVYNYILIRRYSSRLKRFDGSFKHILPIYFVLLTVGLALIIALMAVDNPGIETLHWQTINGENEADSYYQRDVCALNDDGVIIAWIMIGYGIALVLAVLVGSYHLSAKGNGGAMRSQREIYNMWKAETRRAFMVCLIVLLCMVIAIFAALLLEDNDQVTAKEWALFLAGFLAIFGTLLAFYGPKVWTLIFRRNWREPITFNQFNSGVTSNRKSTTGGGSGTSTPRLTAATNGTAPSSASSTPSTPASTSLSTSGGCRNDGTTVVG